MDFTPPSACNSNCVKTDLIFFSYSSPFRAQFVNEHPIEQNHEEGNVDDADKRTNIGASSSRADGVTAIG